MTLYAKEGRKLRPATEPEILSAYGRIMAGRRNDATGGRPQTISREDQAAIREQVAAANRSERVALIAELAAKYGVSTRTIRRAAASEE